LTADVYETEDGDAFVVEIPVPGLSANEITIEATGYQLTVSTLPKQAKSESGRRYFQRDNLVQAMSRIFDFPDEIDTDNVQATLEHGLLQIHVPKAAASRRKVIKVGQSA
jgi:HSP20 family protein